MSEDNAQERSLPASARRLEKAREEGRVARSPELGTAMVLGSAALVLWWAGGRLIAQMQLLLGSGLRIRAQDVLDPVHMLRHLSDSAANGLSLTLPLLLALALAAVVPSMLLGGWLFSWKAIRFDANRLNPLSGMGRVSSGHGAAELGKALLKALLLAGAMAWLLWHFREEAATLAAAGPGAGLGAAGNMLLHALMALVGVTVLVAALDVPMQLWRHHSSLRMTLREMKEEARETDGDPQVRARIRARQREMARRRMMAEVPTADVVVTNPTHYAVALRYRGERMGAPVVVAKGMGQVALRIREIAREHGVPTLEAPPLARALHRHAEIGEQVPAALYGAVAQVLAYVYRLRQPRTGAAPPAPTAIEVPAGLDPEEAA